MKPVETKSVKSQSAILNAAKANPLATDLDHVLMHTAPDWEQMRNARLFITGGTGFFGCWLLESFAWANQRLSLNASATVLTRDPQAFARKAQHLHDDDAIDFVTGDVRDFEFPAGKYDFVIHAATDASARVVERDPAGAFSTIVDGTRRVLQFANQCGAKKFLFTSSGAVYGKQPPELSHIPESYSGAPDPLKASSAYAEGKRAAELLCAMHTRGSQMELKIARCFAFVGPYLPMDSSFAIGNFIRDALRGGPIKIEGDGTACRSYLYAADLAIWLWTILFRAPALRPYNVGSEQAVSIRELAEETSRAIGSVDIQVAKEPVAGAPVARYVPSTRAAREELGLREYISLHEAIVRTAKWCGGGHGKAD